MRQLFLGVILVMSSISMLAQGTLFGLSEQFNGQYGYTMTGNTLLEGPNSIAQFCNVLDASSADINIPTNTSIVKAYLFWSASGERLENVLLNGTKVDKLYSKSASAPGNPDFIYTYGKSDVTELVKNNPTSSYTFSGLQAEINRTIGDYCPGDLIAGWALLVIYEGDELPYNSISLFEGFKRALDELVLYVDLDVSTTDDANGSVSLLAWDGDFSGVTEAMYFNYTPLENEYNTYNYSLFNNSNTYTQDERCWGMDLDYFSISNLLSSTTERAQIHISNFGTPPVDDAYLQLFVVELENKLPNPAFKMLDYRPNICGKTELDVVFEVSNPNTSETLPAGVEVNFYREVFDRELLDTYITNRTLEPDESFVDSMTITVDNFRLDALFIDGEINKTPSGETLLKELFPADNADRLHAEGVGIPTFFFPTGFSPNGDGINDYFTLMNAEDCVGNIQESLLTIYDRYGNIAYSTTDLAQAWDGRNTDGFLIPGTYLWTVSFQTPAYQGTFNRAGSITVFK